MPGAFALGTISPNSPKGSAFQSVQPSVLPVGILQMFAGATAPVGWLLCDGSNVSRTTYASLFSVIGTTYGVGDGNTTFTLPDCRGRVPMGTGQGSGLTNRPLGSTAGSENTTLAVANLPSHTHGFTPTGSLNTESSHTHGSANAGGHSHGSSLSVLAYVASGGGANLNTGTTWNSYNMSSIMSSAGDHGHGSTNSNTGHTHSFTGNPGTTDGGSGTATAITNMQPSLAVNFIIKF